MVGRSLSRLALKRTCILTDKLRFVAHQGHKPTYDETRSAVKNADVVILGKEHYKEQNRSFPVQSRRELNKILALEAANSEQVVLHKIGKYIDGQRQVLYWTVSREVFSNRQLAPLLVIPESALLLSQSDNRMFSVTRNDRTFWFVGNQGGILSAEKRGLLSNANMFLASAGVSAQIEQVDLTEGYLEHLLANYLPTITSNLLGFNPRLRKMEAKDWRKHGLYSGTVASVLLVAYFGLTSFYLNMRLNQAKETQAELSTQVTEVFSVQKQLLAVQEKSQQLNSVIYLPDVSNIPWRFIVPLLQNKVKVKGFTLAPSGLYSISCEAKKATEVLEMIKSDTAVVEPRFRGQVNNYDGIEHFSVEFKIKEGV